MFYLSHQCQICPKFHFQYFGQHIEIFWEKSSLSIFWTAYWNFLGKKFSLSAFSLDWNRNRYLSGSGKMTDATRFGSESGSPTLVAIITTGCIWGVHVDMAENCLSPHTPISLSGLPGGKVPCRLWPDASHTLCTLYCKETENTEEGAPSCHKHDWKL